MLGGQKSGAFNNTEKKSLPRHAQHVDYGVFLEILQSLNIVVLLGSQVPPLELVHVRRVEKPNRNHCFLASATTSACSLRSLLLMEYS